MTRPSIWHGDPAPTDPPGPSPRERFAVWALVLIAVLLIALGLELAFGGPGGPARAVLARTLHVRKPADSEVHPWRLGDTGAVWARWRLDEEPSVPSRPMPLFGHFAKHDNGGNLIFRCHYHDYGGRFPALQLCLGWREVLKTDAGRITPWERGRWYQVFAFWRPVAGGTRTEVGIYVDGRLVGWRLLERLRIDDRPFPVRIGAEKASTTIDPSFPAVHWLDGRATIVLVTETEQ